MRGDYQASIDNMTKLSQPDRLDRRTRADRLGTSSSPSGSARPPSPPLSGNAVLGESAAMPEREERIDELLDMIASRQSHYTKEKDTDKP